MYIHMYMHTHASDMMVSSSESQMHTEIKRTQQIESNTIKNAETEVAIGHSINWTYLNTVLIGHSIEKQTIGMCKNMELYDNVNPRSCASSRKN